MPGALHVMECFPTLGQGKGPVYDGPNLNRVIYPVEGKGLWSTLKGFLALGKDEKNKGKGTGR